MSQIVSVQPPATIRTVADPDQLACAAAYELRHCAENAIRERERFTVALAGGTTPLCLYSFLADPRNEVSRELPWTRIHFFFNDERCVGPENPESNYYNASRALFSKVPIPQANIHRVLGELEPEEGAAKYESLLRDFFRLSSGEWPQFDLILLGLGTDGHTASLLPGTTALDERTRLVIANWVPQQKAHRITLTFTVLNHARQALFLVSGHNKASIVRDIFAAGDCRYPCQEVKPLSCSPLWIIDSAAAQMLGNTDDIAGTAFG